MLIISRNLFFLHWKLLSLHKNNFDIILTFIFFLLGMIGLLDEANDKQIHNVTQAMLQKYVSGILTRINLI